MFKRLHILVVRTYIGPLVLTFFIAIFILLMQFLWKHIEDLVGKGLEWTVIAELLLYASAGLVPMALPLSILLSSIMTFGNMGENNELLALKSSGVSLQRIMFPLIILTIIISISAFFFSNNVLPYTNLKTGTILYDVSHQRPELNIKPGTFNNDVEGYTIRIDRKDMDKNMLYNFMIYDHTGHRGNPSVTTADSALMNITADERYLVLTLFNGYGYHEVEEKSRKKHYNTYPMQRDKFEEKTIIVELVGFDFKRSDESLFKKNYQMMNISQLEFMIDSLSDVVDKKERSFTRNLLVSTYLRQEVKDSAGVLKTNKKNKPVKIPDSIAEKKQNDSLKAAKKQQPKTKKLPQKITARRIKKSNENPLDSNLFEKGEFVAPLADSLLAQMPKVEQRRILEVAVNYARNAKTEISFAKEDRLGFMKWLRRHQIEWHRKFTLSFACFIFFFIGAPLGAIIRKGGLGMPVVISVLFFVFYYIISLSGEKFVRESVLPAWQGMWISSTILLPMGIFLTYKAANDSVIMNIDTYLAPLKKIIGIRLKKSEKVNTTKKNENTSTYK